MNKNLILFEKRPARGERLPESYYVENADGFAASFCDGVWQLGCMFDENQLRKDFRDTVTSAHKFLWRARMSFIMRALEKHD